MSAGASDLNGLVDVFAKAVAAEVVRALRGPAEDGWIDQHSSPLGVRRHCRAARARLAQGKPGASKVGRKWLLSRAALQEAITGESGASDAVRDSIERKLRVAGVR